jgi:glycosyltransferase involved in cell wall biosynthesis
MRVLHLLASPFFTGPAEAVKELALAQRALGHEVWVAIDAKRGTTTSEELAAPRLMAAQLLLDPPPLELSVKSSPWAMLQDVLALRRLEYDVVHCHFSHDHSLVRLGRPKGAAVVRSLHAPRSLRFSTPAADGWTVPTDTLARKLLGAPVLVLPPLVDAAFTPAADRKALRQRLGLPLEGPLVGMVSTFQASRHHEVALAAFKLLLVRAPAATLVLVGDGGLQAALEAQAASLGIQERARFVGYQSGPAFVEHLQALDEVWILGLGNDFSGRAAAQARACEVRVVAVDEGALARNADVLIERTAEALAEAALAGARLPHQVERPAQIAARVLELYEKARGGLT